MSNMEKHLLDLRGHPPGDRKQIQIESFIIFCRFRQFFSDLRVYHMVLELCIAKSPIIKRTAESIFQYTQVHMMHMEKHF